MQYDEYGEQKGIIDNENMNDRMNYDLNAQGRRSTIKGSTIGKGESDTMNRGE